MQKTYSAFVLFVCLATYSLPGMNIGLRLSLWDDGVEPATGQSEIELQEQRLRVPMSWLEKYPTLLLQTYGDYSTALRTPTGKFDMKGRPLYVWHDYVFGTNPLDANDVFMAIISMNDKVNISWTPKLTPEEESKRIYTVYGKVSLLPVDNSWIPLKLDEDLSQYHFFKIDVRLK